MGLVFTEVPCGRYSYAPGGYAVGGCGYEIGGCGGAAEFHILLGKIGCIDCQA